MSEQERHFYDMYAKHCLDALPNFLYDRLETGMAAKAGADGSAEWADVYGKGKRVCESAPRLERHCLAQRKACFGVRSGIVFVTRLRGDKVFRPYD